MVDVTVQCAFGLFRAADKLCPTERWVDGSADELAYYATVDRERAES